MKTVNNFFMCCIVAVLFIAATNAKEDEDSDVTVTDDNEAFVSVEDAVGKKEDCGCSKLSRNSPTSSVTSSDEKTAVETNDKEKGDVEYPRTNQMVYIEGGKTTIGTDEPHIYADGEHPKRYVYVDSFYLDIHEVSNAEFERFVKATGYVTEV